MAERLTGIKEFGRFSEIPNTIKIRTIKILKHKKHDFASYLHWSNIKQDEAQLEKPKQILSINNALLI